MSYSIEYCLDISAKEFSARVGISLPASTESGELSEKVDHFFECQLYANGVDVHLDLSGRMTVLWTPWRYSHLSLDEVKMSEVLTFESFLLSKFSDVKIVRIDEFLLNEFEKTAGELWSRDEKFVTQFWPWLSKQDLSGWAQINSTYGLKPYKAIIWTGDEAGERVEILALSLELARENLKAQFGADAKISLWNEEEANKPR